MNKNFTYIGGRINRISKSIDNLSIEFGLPWRENIQPNNFCFGECWITADKYQHWERRLQYCEVRKEKEPFWVYSNTSYFIGL